jgi:hypothetical protein
MVFMNFDFYLMPYLFGDFDFDFSAQGGSASGGQLGYHIYFVFTTF